MRLTQFTDYALRLLIHLAAFRSGNRTTIGEAARFLGIPLNHLTKIVHRLAKADLIKTSRGRAGGLSLTRPASEISVGEAIRVTEPDFAMVGCLAGRPCALEGKCGLIPVIDEALQAFLRTADRTKLSDLVLPETATKPALGSVSPHRGDECG